MLAARLLKPTRSSNASEAGERAEIAPILATPDAKDDASYARPLEARVHHVALDLTVDFDAKRVGGTATLDIDRKADAKEIVLDDKGLEIESITDGDKQPLQYKVGASDPKLGAPLTVALGPDTKRLVIKYRSAPDAGALQWLTPEQTAGKKKPYLFSQGQAIENRSWIPTQDSPGIRQTWEATIRVPAGLTAVMSAPKAAEPMTQGGESIFSYRMDHSVAPYMIAIAVGDLAFKSLGTRTGVWTEPVMLDRAAAELSDTEKMVEAAEKLYGPYRWGRYDVIVLPPAFPYGGMENPTLTFLTPTFIAGDKSLVGLVAHELAHSWSGNLVTNATWADSWLNEGFTSYFENRIMEAIYGPKRAAQEAALSFDDMEKAFAEEGRTAPITRLNLAEGPSDRRRWSYRHHLRQGRGVPAHDRAHRGTREMGRLSALLLRSPCLPADDLGSLPRRSSREPPQGRQGDGGQASARSLGVPARPSIECRAARSGRLRVRRQGGSRIFRQEAPFRRRSHNGRPQKSCASSTSYRASCRPGASTS